MNDNIIQRVAEGMTTESDATLLIGLVALGILLSIVVTLGLCYYFPW